MRLNGFSLEAAWAHVCGSRLPPVERMQVGCVASMPPEASWLLHVCSLLTHACTLPCCMSALYEPRTCTLPCCLSAHC